MISVETQKFGNSYVNEFAYSLSYISSRLAHARVHQNTIVLLHIVAYVRVVLHVDFVYLTRKTLLDQISARYQQHDLPSLREIF
jgi:hypothetical protein